MGDRPTAKASSPEATASSESLPVLVGRLSDDLTELVDSKLSLLKIELQEDARSYVRRGVRAIAGGVVASLGAGLVGAGAAFFVSSLLRESAKVASPTAYSLGFACVGLLFLIAGAVVAVRAGRALMGDEQTAEKGT